MKKVLLIFTLTTVFPLTFFQCQKKCDSDKLGEIRFTQNDHNIVPYNGLENLIFKDSIGDSLTMQPGITTGRTSSYNHKYYEHAFHEGECPPNYLFVEQNYTHFVDNDHEASIWTNIYFDNPFADSIQKFLFIEVVFDDSQRWFFNGTFFFTSSALFDRKPQESKIVEYKDSLKIGPKWFLKVYTLQQIEEPYGLSNLQYVYYSLNDGVVGFKTAERHLYFLNIKY